MSNVGFAVTVRRVASMFFATCMVFSFLTWGYVMWINAYHLEWMWLPLTHVNVFPLNLRTDIVGIVSFVVAGVSFFLLGVTVESK